MKRPALSKRLPAEIVRDLDRRSRDADARLPARMALLEMEMAQLREVVLELQRRLEERR